MVEKLKGYEESSENNGTDNPWLKMVKEANRERADSMCEKVLGRDAEETARELQLLGLADGHREVVYDNPAAHKEMLEFAGFGVAEARHDEYDKNGRLISVTARLKNGEILTDRRHYIEKEPQLNFDKIAEYERNGFIDDQDRQTVNLIYRMVVGDVMNLSDETVEELREGAAGVKDKIVHAVNEQYKEALFHDDGQDRDGLRHFETEDGQKIVLLNGAPFKMLTHVRDAMVRSRGERGSSENQNFKTEWNTIKGDAAPHALSTSLISDEKLNLFMKGEIIFGFSELQGDAIVTMGAEDLGSYGGMSNRYGIRSSRYNEKLMSPDELLAKTGSRAEELGECYNEVVLDRFLPHSSEMIQPDFLIVFGKDESSITEAQAKCARDFDIPIYIIDDEKYGGLKTTMTPEAEKRALEIENTRANS